LSISIFFFQKPCPEGQASFPSRLTFSWFSSFALLGFRRPLLTTDLWNLNYEDMASEVIPLFDKYWDALLKKNKYEENQYVGHYYNLECYCGN
jgi:hypothetical protein